MTEDRKNDHIGLAFSSRAEEFPADPRFSYEPLTGYPGKGVIEPFQFLGRTLRTPIWVSSMTGGATNAATINRNLARACNEFGMGMALGSCRVLLENDRFLPDFDVRDIIGNDLPLYANIGIVQLEEIVLNKSTEKIIKLVELLRADGLVIHVNPVQEWLQVEGSLFKCPPADTIEEFLASTGMKVIVKEVGQGMGEESIRQIMRLHVEAFELAAYGGTNFARIELARSGDDAKRFLEPIAMIGHTAGEMLEIINRVAGDKEKPACRQIIVSGGIGSFLDGYYYMSKSILPAIYGQASAMLKHARGDYQDLKIFIQAQIDGLRFARAFLKVKNQA